MRFVVISDMQRFQLEYREMSRESLVFSRFIQELLGKCVHQENTSKTWDISWYVIGERCETI